jgi:hypothetical protein
MVWIIQSALNKESLELPLTSATDLHTSIDPIVGIRILEEVEEEHHLFNLGSGSGQSLPIPVYDPLSLLVVR